MSEPTYILDHFNDWASGYTKRTVSEIDNLFRSLRVLGSQNRIINGGMRFAQRGTSFAAVADGDYTLDRWVYKKSGAMVHTITQDSTDAYDFAIKLDVTTVDASIAAGDYCYLAQRIEGYNVRDFISQGYGVLTFEVKSPKTGVHCVALHNSADDKNYIVEYEIDTADTWETKRIMIPFDFSGGTWDYTTGIGLEVRWVLACGTTYQAAADEWIATDDMATANQVNCCDNTANNFYLRKVGFYPGQVAIPFIANDYQAELARCQRYCWRFTSGLTYAVLITGFASTTTTVDFAFPYPIPMRAIPTMSMSAATHWIADDTVTSWIIDSWVVKATSHTKEIAVIRGTRAVASLTQFRPHFLSANNNAAAWIDFNAEL